MVSIIHLQSELRLISSLGSLKIWNMKTFTCIRTMECGHAVCSTFLPGDRQVALGAKSGEVLVYDIASSSLLETIQAHTATVWSMHVRADGQALVTGSADKDVKFWEFVQQSVDSGNVSIKWYGVCARFNIELPASQHEIALTSPCTDAEDDRRRSVGAVQPQREAACSRSFGLYREGLLPGHSEVLPFALWTQGKHYFVLFTEHTL